MSDGPNMTPAVEDVRAESLTPLWFRRATLTAGVFALIAGVPVSINLFCLVPLTLLNNSGSDVSMYGVVSLTIGLLTLGAGWAAFFHGNRSGACQKTEGQGDRRGTRKNPLSLLSLPLSSLTIYLHRRDQSSAHGMRRADQ